VLIVKLTDVVHGKGTKNTKSGHNHEPEGIAVLRFSDFENASCKGERDRSAIVLKRVDDPRSKACHFFASNIHRGSRSDDRVGGVGGKGDQDKNGAAEKDSSRCRPHMAEQEDDGCD